MHDRPSRFAAFPGDIKPPRRELYPSRPVAQLTRWLVRMVVESELWGESWIHEARVWAFSSEDAVRRARDEFYGSWATRPADRQRLPLRVVEVSQVGI